MSHMGPTVFDLTINMSNVKGIMHRAQNKIRFSHLLVIMLTGTFQRSDNFGELGNREIRKYGHTSQSGYTKLTWYRISLSPYHRISPNIVPCKKDPRERKT